MNSHALPPNSTAEPASPRRYAIGETDFECWDRLWKASPSDPEVEGEEWVTFSERIQEYFRGSYENFPDDFYFWNEFSSDRTLDLKIVKPSVLTARLLLDLQKYIQMHGQKMWRIRIPIYFKPNDCHRVIVVYPHAIDIPPLRNAALRLLPAWSLPLQGAPDSSAPSASGHTGFNCLTRVKTLYVYSAV
jgi:hypothetical protein